MLGVGGRVLRSFDWSFLSFMITSVSFDLTFSILREYRVRMQSTIASLNLFCGYLSSKQFTFV